MWRLLHLLKRKRLLAGLAWSVQGLLLMAGFILLLLVFSNLHTYHRLTHEAVVADVFIQQLGPQRYRLALSLSQQDQDQHEFVVEGDQWQLDARILKWKGWANLIGLNSFYQLQRLSGRYADIEQAKSRLPSVHDLRQPQRGLDVFRLKQYLRDNMTFVDAQFGQGVYMPMIDGAHYQVSIGQQGLLVRPSNDVVRSMIIG